MTGENRTSRSFVGTRLRERRRALGLTQAALAQRAGISASYLNLIERNRRGIGGRLLARLAGELGLRPSEVDGATERRLQERLAAIARDPRLAGLGVEANAAGELIGRYPGWARAVAALARAEEEQSALAQAFADRMTHDPFLGETVHRMLTRIAAIRSTAEILDGVPDIGAEQAGRFHAILSSEARALTEVAEALAGYFDRAASETRDVTPSDEVEALFQEHGNRFPAIDRALEDMAPPASETALRGAAEMRAGPVIDRLIAEAPGLSTGPARGRARRALLRYAMDAARLPIDLVAERAAAAGYDLDALVAREGWPADVTCRRLAALEPGAGVPRFGYVAANAAGALFDLREVPGFHPIRHGTICPLWVLCRAQQAPERAMRQLAAMPTGHRFVFVARAAPLGAPEFGRPRHFRTDMLVLSEADAALTVYAPRAPGELEAEEVGTSCRVCPRKGCGHRVEDPLAA